MSGYSSWLGMQHKIPDRSRIYGSSRTWLVSKTICLQIERSPYTEKCGISMALGQPLALAALISAGLRKSQVLRVPVRPVRHQLNHCAIVVERSFLTNPIFISTPSASLLSRSISFSAGQHRPNDPGILVRQRHRGDVLVAPGNQSLQPTSVRLKCEQIQLAIGNGLN